MRSPLPNVRSSWDRGFEHSLRPDNSLQFEGVCPFDPVSAAYGGISFISRFARVSPPDPVQHPPVEMTVFPKCLHEFT